LAVLKLGLGVGNEAVYFPMQANAGKLNPRSAYSATFPVSKINNINHPFNLSIHPPLHQLLYFSSIYISTPFYLLTLPRIFCLTHFLTRAWWKNQDAAVFWSKNGVGS
jgi:hypothetical protein